MTAEADGKLWNSSIETEGISGPGRQVHRQTEELVACCFLCSITSSRTIVATCLIYLGEIRLNALVRSGQMSRPGAKRE